MALSTVLSVLDDRAGDFDTVRFVLFSDADLGTYRETLAALDPADPFGYRRSIDEIRNSLAYGMGKSGGLTGWQSALIASTGAGRKRAAREPADTLERSRAKAMAPPPKDPPNQPGPSPGLPSLL